MSAPTIVVLMGVSGSGETTVGEALPASLGWRFLDGDADRSPWRDRIADASEPRRSLGSAS